MPCCASPTRPPGRPSTRRRAGSCSPSPSGPSPASPASRCSTPAASRSSAAKPPRSRASPCSSRSAPATAARLAPYAGLTILVGVAVTGLAVSGRVLPSGARALLAVAAALTLAGGVVRFLAEQARIGAPLGTLLASSTGQGLLRLAAGVVATAVATWFLAAGLARPPDPLTPDPSPGEPDPALAA